MIPRLLEHRSDSGPVLERIRTVTLSEPAHHPALQLQRVAGNRTVHHFLSRTEPRIQRANCPEVVSLTAKVIDPTVSDSCGKACRLGLGCCPTKRGSCGSTKDSGTTITAKVKVGEGCVGELAFMQNILSTARRRTLSSGARQCIDATEPHIDSVSPWKGCVQPVDKAGEHTISTDDCPNLKLDDATSVSVTEQFKTFLTWTTADTKGRKAIAWVIWAWSGSTNRVDLKGKKEAEATCASSWSKPTGSHTDGTGSASSDKPVTKPKIQDLDWKDCS